MSNNTRYDIKLLMGGENIGCPGQGWWTSRTEATEWGIANIDGDCWTVIPYNKEWES